MTHKNKNKDNENLIYIEKKDENESATSVAIRVMLMIDREFNLTIEEITKILKCDRQWVAKYVQNNVKHIFLNDKYRLFLMKVNEENFIINSQWILKDYYYFSREDFFRWLKENTVATRKTIMLDIGSYYSKDLKNKAKNIVNTTFKMLKNEEKIKENLSDIGKEFFDKRLGVTNRKDTNEINIKNFELPKILISIKELKEYYGKNLEIIYRDLYKYGAIKYTIANSLVRYDSSFSTQDFEITKNSYLITIPYEYYLKKIKIIKKG